jgi:hypothetical protein
MQRVPRGDAVSGEFLGLKTAALSAAALSQRREAAIDVV